MIPQQSPVLYADRVQETSTTTGAGNFTLAGAVAGFQSFASAFVDGSLVQYCIENGTDWEVGIGSVAAGVLTRITIQVSSNANSVVSFAAGTKRVFCQLAAAHLLVGARVIGRVPVTPGAAQRSYGDSITSGSGTSNARYRYAERLAQRFGTVLNNLGVSGTGTWATTKSAFINEPIYGRRRDFITVMAGFNDIYRGGSAAKTISKVQGEFRSFLANGFLDYAVPGTDASVTLGGAWSTMGGTFGEKASNSLGGNGKSTVVNTATFSWTFTGDALVVGCYNADGVSQHVGSFTVVIDGVTVEVYSGEGKTDGISDGVYNNQLTHEARVYSGLGSGSHTVVITATGASGGVPVYIDYVGTLAPAAYAGSIVVAEPPYVNTAGWATGGGIWSLAAMWICGQAIRSVIDEFPNYPVSIARTNDFYNVVNIFSDNQHPNDVGNGQIADAFSEAVSIYPRLPLQGVKALVDAATVTPDASMSTDFRLLTTVGIGATRVIGNPVGLSNGDKINIRVKLGAASHAWTYGTKWKLLGTAITRSTASGSVILISAQYDSTDDTVCYAESNSA